MEDLSKSQCLDQLSEEGACEWLREAGTRATAEFLVLADALDRRARLHPMLWTLRRAGRPRPARYEEVESAFDQSIAEAKAARDWIVNLAGCMETNRRFLLTLYTTSNDSAAAAAFEALGRALEVAPRLYGAAFWAEGDDAEGLPSGTDLDEMISLASRFCGALHAVRPLLGEFRERPAEGRENER